MHADMYHSLTEMRQTLLLKLANEDELQELAERVWRDLGSQEGFVLAARKLYATSIERRKKYDRAFTYAQNKIVTLGENGHTPIAGLYAVALDVYYHWLVRRPDGSTQYHTIDWDMIKAYSTRVLASGAMGKDPLYTYLHALALAHKRQWKEANAVFYQLRTSGLLNPILHARRDSLRDETGYPVVLQGTVRPGTDKQYLLVETLQQDFLMARGPWPAPGGIAHATIEFSFAGPKAYLHERPRNRSVR